MSKALIIAEKPSVASDIAKALGGFRREGDYFESEQHVLCSAIGHLVEIAAPEGVEVTRGKWSFAHLPVLPDHFAVRPIPRYEERLRLLTRLIRRKDVNRLINACDAGREGELIFQLIVQHAKAKQPVRRLWLQSMTPAAIRDAFGHLRDQSQMQALADAARCRSEADWLVGINGTRAMTAFNSREGGFFLTTVGRVQTPTLAIVVEREERIRRFVARPYQEVSAAFAVAKGNYEARWFDPSFKRQENDPEGRAERIWQPDQAARVLRTLEQHLKACDSALARDESKPSVQSSPALFDLTSLQREANARFGFSAKTTLALAQALYEKHKLLTYPRTDSKHLPEDYLDTVRQTLEVLGEVAAFSRFAREILDRNWVRPNKRVFDNTKVSDHFAIIPTPLAPRPGGLSEAEAKLHDLVARRFLAAFYPPAQHLVTTRITRLGELHFRSEGRVLLEAGWLSVLGREAGETTTTLPPLSPPQSRQEAARLESFAAHELSTRPPARFSEATLLSAMEGAGKLVDEEDWREAMAGKGLGTPATRAAIIEGLILENYLFREGRELLPTTKAFQLLTLLRGLGVKELTLPELTGDWEYKLAQMERGKLARPQFMAEITQMARQIVERAKNYEANTIPGDFADLKTPCPACGSLVRENYRRYACTACDFSLAKTPGARTLAVEEAEKLLADRVIGPLSGFRSKAGRPFVALLRLSEANRLEFDFGQANAPDNGSPVDLEELEPLGACPRCGARVFAQALSFVCEQSLTPTGSCDFRSARTILQQSISAEQMTKLLNERRSDLLSGFVSKKTGRKFKAWLVLDTSGKVQFDFPLASGKAEVRATGESATNSSAGNRAAADRSAAGIFAASGPRAGASSKGTSATGGSATGKSASPRRSRRAAHLSDAKRRDTSAQASRVGRPRARRDPKA
jgi:DNA topoisomerase-3